MEMEMQSFGMFLKPKKKNINIGPIIHTKSILYFIHHMTEFHVTFPDIQINTGLFDLIKNIKNIKPLKPEIKIDDVHIACQIGSGKFSDVFLAIVGPDCYALKIFKPYYHHRVEEERNTLLLLTKYGVPNIPRLISTFSVTESRREAFLMDLMYEHYNINKIRELTIDVKIAIIYKIFLSLKRANEAGIIHGNICPSNILIDSSLEQFKSNKKIDLKLLVNLLIVGWNISIRNQDRTMFQRISSNKSVSIQYTIDHKDYKIWGGDLAFKAPELLVHKKMITSKVDVWSVGCLFAYFLLGEKEKLWDESEKGSSLPENYEQLRKIALKKGPDDILKSCKEFIPAVHIGSFSSISQQKNPFETISNKINDSLLDIIEKTIYSGNEINRALLNKNPNKEYWEKIYKEICKKPETSENPEISVNDDENIRQLKLSKNTLYKNLNNLIQQCICVSEFTRLNTANALEEITRIRDSLNEFQNSLLKLKKQDE